MRSLVLGRAGALLLVAGCASAQDAAPDTSGQTSSRHPTKEFVARVLGSTEDVWGDLFKAKGYSPYSQPSIVLFTAQTRSACGPVSAAVGPSYCPTDRKVYLDPASLDEFSRRFGAPPNNFGEAYLIVREISRHVQAVLGTTRTVAEQMRPMDASGRNALQARVELQVECYTGVWAHFVRKRNQLEVGDLEAGAAAAEARGNTSTGASSRQRKWWFERGLATGDPSQCDTFVSSKP